MHLNQSGILVTGAAGVLGQRLIKKLAALEVQVIAVDLPETEKSLSALAAAHQNVQTLTADLIDTQEVNRIFEALKSTQKDFSAVFHLAAMGDANMCDRNPKAALECNVVMTTNILEGCAQHHVNRVIYPSTAYVYGSKHKGPIKEECAAAPEGIYPLTKLLAEESIKAYGRFNDLSCDIVRVSNIYGPSSKANTILGTIMHQANTKDEIFLFDLAPVRDFIYVDDVIESLMRILAASDEKGCRTYNVSTGVGTSVGQLAELYCEIEGLSPEIIKSKLPSGNDSVLVLDNALLKAQVNWLPSTTLDEGIKKTIKELKGQVYVKA